MREIKKRAWDEKNEVMHYDFQFIKSGEDGNDWIVFTSDKQKLTDKLHPFGNPYFQQQLKISESVGIKNKNGTEIYYGDVIKNSKGESVVIENRPEFAQIRSAWFWGIRVHFQGFENIEVIGNIYENPELLKGNQKTQ